MTQTNATARLRMADLARTTIAAKGLDPTAPGYIKSIGPKYEAAARLLDEISGKPAVEISRRDVETLASLLARAPKNLKQTGHRGTLRQAIAANERAKTPRPTLSPTTIEFGFLSPLRQIFDCARSVIPQNPAAGVHPAGLPAPRERKAGSRQAFTTEALNTIFASPLYAGAESAYHWHRYGTHVDIRSCRYWLPLLMLHAGLRAHEIVSLAGNDLTYSYGLPLLRLTARPETNQLMPIHPNLIALGFLELFDGSAASLFPGAGATQMLRSFNDPGRFLDGLALKCPETPIDSLRLNFREAVERVFSSRAAATLLGRAGGAALSPRQLHRFWKEVDFPGLDLSRLRDDEGRPAWDERRITRAGDPAMLNARLEINSPASDVRQPAVTRKRSHIPDEPHSLEPFWSQISGLSRAR